MASLPLEGVRILSQGIVWAGPMCTLLLADMGAEVLEVEHIQKISGTRCLAGANPPPVVEQMAIGTHYPDRKLGTRHWDRGATFNYGKRNTLSFTVDWERSKGMEYFLRLVAMSDVFLENNATGVMEKLGINYERLKEANPGIIFIRFPGYGTTGPYKYYKGYGANIEAVAGHTWLRSYPDLDISRMQAIYHGDPTAGSSVAFAILTALHYRKRTGQGQFIDMSQIENMVHHFAHAYMDYSLNQRSQGPWGNRHPSMAPHNCYPCAGQDYWVAIAVEDDEQFQTLCRVMGKPELAQDSRFADAASRYANQEELDPIIAEWTKGKGHYEVMHLLQREGVPAVAVIKQPEMVGVGPQGEVLEPHLKERGYFEMVTHPMTGPIVDGKETPGTHLHPGVLAKLSKTPLSIRTPAPTLGQHNEYVYKKLLGVSDAEYQQLWDEQSIGDTYLPDAKA